MDLFILEPITQPMAKDIIKDVRAAKGPIDVHIMSLGGDMLAGNAIKAVLEASPHKVTTNVIGVAASMAAVISQAGDKRLIAPDASFNIHNGGVGVSGRGTKEEHMEAAEMLESLDNNMIKAFNKTGLSEDQLKTIMQSDRLLNADQSIQLGFFDGHAKPVAAAATFNNEIKDMSTLSELMAKVDVAAIKMGLKSTDDEKKQELVAALETELKAQTDQAIEMVEETAETGADILSSEMVPREEFEMFKAEVLALIEPLLGAVETLPTPEQTTEVVEEVTTAKLDKLLTSIKSKTVAPSARQSFDQPEEKAPQDWSVYEARKQAIKEKTGR
jgi:ATP-dependent protease ClpP protease subunit